MEVSRILGCGFLENVYQEALEYELKLRNIPFISQPKLRLEYKGHKLDQYYSPDFICFGKIILELKSVETLTDCHKAQLLNYLKATHMRLGFLINFNAQPIEIRRFVN